MKLNFKVIFQTLLGITILCLAAIPVVGLVSTASGYKGQCYGFTDGVWNCPWTEYASNEMFWMMLIFSPSLILLAVGWLAGGIFLGLSRLGRCWSLGWQQIITWGGTAVLILVGLIFVGYTLLTLGGGLLSLSLGR